MYLEFYGASEGVTGSLHRIHVNDADVLLDCGMFQGRRAEANAANRETPDWAAKAQSVVLSHAHLDHSGNISHPGQAGIHRERLLYPSDPRSVQRHATGRRHDPGG